MLPQNNADRPSKGAVTVYAAMPGSSPVVLKVSPARPWQIAKQLQSFSYDDDGNLTGDGIWDYQYDAENRLIRMASTDASDSAGLRHQVLEFKYDYMGRRVQKRVVKAAEGSEAASDVYVRYVYDGWNVVAEFSATASSIGTMVRSFTWGLDVAGTLGTTGGVGALVRIADHQNGKTYFPGYDGSGNVSSLVDSADGSLAAIYEYSPFGELLRAEGSYAASNPFRFSTKWTDAESGLSYYGYRYYSPGLGRFINRDPIEESGGLNLFGFVGNNPTSRYDVLGLEMVCLEWEFVPMHTGFDANGDPTYMVGKRCTTYKWVDPYVVTPRASNAEYYAWLAEQDKQAEIRREMESSSSTDPNSTGAASGATAGTATGYGDPNSSYSKGGLTFTTTLTAQHVPGSQPTPRPFGNGPASPMGRDVAGRFIAGDVTVSVTGVQRASPSSISFTVTGVTVTFPTTVYYNSTHWTYSNGAASLDTQYAENQHAIDFWTARDTSVIPMLERMLSGQFNGRQSDAEAQMRREIITIFRGTNADTVQRYDQPGGPHNGGSNPVPNGYPGFP